MGLELNTLGYPSSLTQSIIDDKSLIIYRPRLNQITGSVLATILLHQIIYWANKSQNLFYKFMRPCNHELYKPGDSWEEELGFTRRELEGALKNIAQKYNPKRDSIPLEALVVFYTDIRRLTWYSVNWNKLNTAIEEVFIRNAQNEHYVEHDPCITYSTDRTLLNNDTKTSTKIKQQTAPPPTSKPEPRLAEKGKMCVAAALLEKFGLNHDKVAQITGKFSDAFIQKKLKEIERKFLAGNINNLQGYVISVFERTESEESLIEKENRTKQEMTAKQRKEMEILAHKKEQQEERRHQEYLAITDKLINEANVVELRWFADWLKTESNSVYAMYREKGLKSYIVETYYRRYLYNKYYHIDTGE